MKQLLTAKIIRSPGRPWQMGTPGGAVVALIIALTLASCGQMGDLYQPLPEAKPTEPPTEQPTADSESAEDPTAPGRGN